MNAILLIQTFPFIFNTLILKCTIDNLLNLLKSTSKL